MQAAFPEMAAENMGEAAAHHGRVAGRILQAEPRPGPELPGAAQEEGDSDTGEMHIPMTAKTVIIRGSSMEAEAAAGTAAEPEQSKTVHTDAAAEEEADI